LQLLVAELEFSPHFACVRITVEEGELAVWRQERLMIVRPV
jgi:hypothetical protein